MGDEWIITLKSELDKLNLSAELKKRKKQCIYMVPKVLRDLNNNAYTPQFVSFGPYHHDQDHLKPMEHYKHHALSNYLRRAHVTLEQLAEKMRPEVQDFMDSYDGLEERWTNEDRFLKLMILDGCFLLDRMIWKSVKLCMRYMSSALQMDMLMLENQLPLDVLAVLIEEGGHTIDDNRKFIQYYCSNTPKQLESIRDMGLHLLDISRKQFISDDYFYDPNYDVRPVTELYQAGVRFVLSESEAVISFRNGVLRLPFLSVDDDTESVLLNYIAYEQILNVDSVITSYAFLMDDLINTAQDAALLRKNGIIRGWVGSDHGVAELFNRITKEVTIDNWDDEMNVNLKSKLNVNKELDMYCNEGWHRWRASFIQTYLSNPWVFFSLVGASVLLLLTVTQTVYTILPYYKKS